MAKRIAVNTLNASTIDILNTIRANASYEYQSQVPEIGSEVDIPKVGEILFGYPALANQFINALINRIAQVRVKSAVFNNAYKELKKGFLEYGETVEEVFVSITRARAFSVEKAGAREFKRTLPDVKSAFHTMNWRVQYPVTIQDEDLKRAFLSINGVQDLIAKIVNAVYTAAEYDEYLLFKYLLIKSIANGKMFPVAFDSTQPKNAATIFRGMSNQITFMNSEYNAAGVMTSTPKSDQYIFMDSMYNAEYDVEVLAAAFNMEKAEFTGKLHLIDSWNTFDNERFAEIVAESDQIEKVTPEELALMTNVKAVLLDGEFFQVYDNLDRFTEKYVASGLYWNYFYNVWKTVSSSPFSNAIVFVDDNATITQPKSYTVRIASKSKSDDATVLTLTVDNTTQPPQLAEMNYNFIQTEQMAKDGIAIHPYGAVIIPANAVSKNITLVMRVGESEFTAKTQITASSAVDETVIMSDGSDG